jgi:hypothetical protein
MEELGKLRLYRRSRGDAGGFFKFSGPQNAVSAELRRVSILSKW